MKKSIFKFYCIKVAVSLGIMAVCIGGVLFIKSYQNYQTQRLLDPRDERVRGLNDAPVQIIEYIDFRCGPCAYSSLFLKGFLLRHPKDVRLEARYFPIHKGHDLISFRYAQCAGKQQKFWAFHDRLMGRQRQWIRLKNPQPFFLRIAEQIDLDKQALEACVKDPLVKEKILADEKSGERLGVKATPTYFVNKEVVVGSRNLKQKLNEIFRAMREEQNSSEEAGNEAGQ